MNPRIATLGPPPAKPSSRLGAPPAAVEAKGNIATGKVVHFNVRLDPAKHKEIRMAALQMDMSLQDYLVFLHDRFQEKGA